MINIDELNKYICKLEQGKMSFASCNNLASLYILRDHCSADEMYYDELVKKYSDYMQCKDSDQKANYFSSFLTELQKKMKTLERQGTFKEQDLIKQFFERKDNFEIKNDNNLEIVKK